MRLPLILLWLVALMLPAMAHSGGLPVGPDEVWQYWSFELWVIIPLAVSGGLYIRGTWRLWAKAGMGRGMAPVRVAFFGTGMVMMIAVLISPLDALGETLLSAHMIQHAVLVGIAPPLLLAGWPAPAAAWALPSGMRRSFLLGSGIRGLRSWLGWMLWPVPAAILHGIALWLWHAPAPYEAALQNEAVHALEHVSFFATAMFFWHSMFRAARSAATIPAGVAAGFFTLLHGGFLSALITFAPHPLYDWYEGRTMAWGMDALTDQQLAGLIMGVPLSMIYLGASLALVARLLAPADEAHPLGIK